MANVYRGSELLDFFNTLEVLPKKERNIMPNLLAFIGSKSTDRVAVLYGLRRTGKSTLMRQVILNHIGVENAAYVVCQKVDKMSDIENIIKNTSQRCIFLDEVTRVTDFMEMSSALADIFAISGKKIILAGTDSLGFKIAKGDELLDRVYMLHTTYISYSEFNYLLDKDIFDYMRYGGTLCEASPFNSKDSLNEYMNSSIVDNILHTYDLWDDGEHYSELLRGFTKQELRSLITYYVRREVIRFLASELEQFKASEFHVPAKIIKKDRDLASPNIDAILQNDKLTKAWQEQLKIMETYTHEVSDAALEAIAMNLISLDVLYLLELQGDRRFYFSQPGMRYCHIEEAFDLISNNPELLEHCTQAEIDYVMMLFRNNIEGHLLENIVLADLFKRYNKNPDIKLRQFRQNNAEYDVVISNSASKKSIVYEVKRSSEIVDRQKKWLVDSEFQKVYEAYTGYRVVSKAVLYNGETTTDSEGMPYINTGEFLIKADTYTHEVTDISTNSKLLIAVFKKLEDMKVPNSHAWILTHSTSEILSILGMDTYAM